MSSNRPTSELVSKAASFVTETRKADPERSLDSILDEAGMRFNLTPLEGEALRGFFCGPSQTA